MLYLHTTLLALWLGPMSFPATGGPAPAATDEGALAEALELVDAEDLRENLTFLASDLLRGRCAGEDSADRAADYLASRLAGLGLDPVGPDGSYFQEFEFRVRGGKGGATAVTRNVLGLWEGSDPALKDQVIVVGAHYDHVGTVESADAGRIGTLKGDDAIWNGADDNGSGSVTVLEIAEAFARSGLRPRRSILFMWFGAEEQGLLGSAYYCANPIFPLEDTAAMINLDMVGRNPDQKLSIMGVASLRFELWKTFLADAEDAAPDLRLARKDYALSDSDHDSFLSVGVPAIFLFSGMHTDYHRVTDHADLIAYDRMVQVGRFTTALLNELGNSEEDFQFQKPQFRPRGRKSLDINTDGALTTAEVQELGYGKDQGGFRVKTVRKGSPGADAGLEVDDVILKVRGKTINPDDPNSSLRRLVAASPSGRDVLIVVWRDGEEVTLVARF